MTLLSFFDFADTTIFAACFIMPENGMLELIPDKEKTGKSLISTETLFRIQHYFNVSFNTLIYTVIAYYRRSGQGRCLSPEG